MQSDSVASGLIDRYFAEDLAHARAWSSTADGSDAARLALQEWQARGELDRLTATKILMWATNRALRVARAAPDFLLMNGLMRAQQERRALVQWLQENGHDYVSG